MAETEISRLSRLTAILTLLQSQRLITASFIANKFNISIRTVYRDIRALEEAGVPIYTEEGKGYSLMEGYRLPPIMFTETEANALITAEQLIIKNKDASFVKHYTDAITKIKSVLRYSTKDKSDLLSKRIEFRQNAESNTTSNYLSEIQLGITNFKLIKINYISINTNIKTTRVIEPFALYSTQENWILIALCRLRKDYRAFRLDQIQHLELLNDPFKPHPYTLQEYFESYRKKYFDHP